MPDRLQRLRIVWLYGVLGWGLAGAALWLPAMQLSGVLGDDFDSALAGLILFPMAGYVAGRMMWGQRQQLAPTDQFLSSEADVHQARTLADPTGFYELAPTWGLATRIWWALTWRGMVVMLVSGIIGGLLGAMLASVFSGSQPLPEVTQMFAQLLGAVIGAAASVVPVRVILGRDFGDFRLVLLARRPRRQASPAPLVEPQSGFQPATLAPETSDQMEPPMDADQR